MKKSAVLMDRRSRRSRRVIKAALLDLMQHKEIQKISITELSEIADINRKTFYNHFWDVQAVLEEIEDDLLHDLLAITKELKLDLYQASAADLYVFIQRLVQISDGNGGQYAKLATSLDAPQVVFSLKNKILGFYPDDESVQIFINNDTFNFLITFLSGGILATVKGEFLNNSLREPEKFQQHLLTLAR